MKYLKLILSTVLVVFVSSWESWRCDCEYVTYSSNPTNNYTWTETYRSTWDSSCHDEVLSESTSTISGNEWYSRTEIECN